MRTLLTSLMLLFPLSAAMPAQADPLKEGQRLAEEFLRGDLQVIWEESTAEMQDGFGSVENLVSLRDQLKRDLGEEQEVLTEQLKQQAGYDVFKRVSRWTNLPQPIELTISFDEAEKIAGFFVKPLPVAAPSPYLDYETKAKLRLPVKGKWYVYWGGRDIEKNYHAVDAGQRFAIDLLVMENGKSHEGDPTDLGNYHCWNRPIFAPADGTVVRATDGLPDQPIGSADAENPAGNHVVIDFGDGEYGFLAHLQENSVQVTKGDRVTAGQQIGKCGNSGNTSEPHLHFHLQTKAELGKGKGLPAQFTNYRANGEKTDRGEPVQGEIIQPME